jgi:hypothetical protein
LHKNHCTPCLRRESRICQPGDWLNAPWPEIRALPIRARGALNGSSLLSVGAGGFPADSRRCPEPSGAQPTQRFGSPALCWVLNTTPLCAVNMNTPNRTVAASLDSAAAPATFGHAGGMKPAVERSDTAGTPRKSACIPTGCQHAPGALSRNRTARWHPFRMRFFWGVFRWCRFARPPANRCDASGI